MSRQALVRIQVANDRVAQEVDRALMRVLARTDLSNPLAAREALFESIPTLIDRYGDVAATAAAEWFEEFRILEGISGPFRADLASNVPLEMVQSRLGFATRDSGALFAGQLDDFAAFMSLMVNEYTMQPGHDTITLNTGKDNAAYARVPEPGACDFCLMLASRGFVYSKKTMGTEVGKKFHGNCRCHGMPVWDETRARVEYGYDPEKLYDEYVERTYTK